MAVHSGAVAALHDMPPRGHYLADEVGQLVGVSGNRIGQWARYGFIRSSQSDGRPRVYSYQDIAEAMVVHELEERGLEPRDIRQSVEYLRDRLGTEWPLTKQQLRIPTDHPKVDELAKLRGANKPKKHAIVVTEEAGPVDATTGQPVLTESALTEIRSNLERGGWVARTLPDLRYIEVNPDRLSGRPTIRGKRVSAEDVARTAAGQGFAVLRDDYDLTDDEIRDAVRWWDAVQRAA
jgi:uncharacterized protein (DUF433 family)/DNA-binding transcriptional MerR regulator